MADEIAYPIGQFQFQVDWTDTTIVCSEVSGLSSTREVMEYCDAKTQWVTAQPGLQSFDDVTFTKAIFESDDAFSEWTRKTIEREDGFGDTVVVTLMNELQEPVFIWELQGAHVLNWKQPDMESMGNEVAVETLTIVCENITTQVGG